MYLFFTVLGVLTTALILDQIWVGVVEFDIFWKLLITIGVVGGLVTAVYLLKNEFVEDRKMKKDKYLD